MDSMEKGIAAINEQGILPLFYHDDAELCKDIVRVLYECGIRVIEFTNRGENALANFRQLLSLKEDGLPDLKIAVGTIRTAEQADDFIAAGADMLISPVFDADIADRAYLHKKLWIPGCMTPTEIHVAQKAGCNLVKLFPGNVLGPGFVSGVRELFPGLNMMPTGGVEVEEKNIRGWFDAGVCAVGLGSKLISKDLLAKRDFDKLRSLTKEAIELVKRVRNN
ncbi:MAG: bifunctional 4-hydroxy-2-oxoglutarate aldolase/2-dehydro-3-deoxy-phosphogluconate aldolase [Chitinophagaceae bacterium]|nr:bifunctional 4-hydroxy-2-oxoglutarate aldolase/2-dehydro-3-deoxy-phosphogluconate aldolase [Chitinophagaceae bacterium]